jgi:hypothetical protein
MGLAALTLGGISKMKWEYKIVALPLMVLSDEHKKAAHYEQILNTFGIAGWEAVNMDGIFVLMKRKKEK